MTAERSVGRPGREASFLWALAIITLLAGWLRLQGIGEQAPIFDEVLALFSAEGYRDHGLFGLIMVYHPHWRDLAILLTTDILGFGALGLRGMSILLGILGIPLLGILVYRIAGSRIAGVLAAFFLALDPVHITFSRQALQEVHTIFFLLLAVWVFVEGWRSRSPYAPAWLWPLSGVFFGLGLASKSHTLFPLAMCLVVGVWQGLELRSRPRLALVATCLVVLPAVVYVFTYLPWFERGYDLVDWVFMQKAQFITMATHQGNPMDSLADTSPALWFVKPLMGYGNFVEIEGEPKVTLAVGNPLVWLLVLPAVVYLFLKLRRDPGVRWFLGLFWISYLPLVLTTRPVWVLSSVAVTPFAYALVGLFLDRWILGKSKALLSLYLVSVLLATLLLYPLAIGQGWDYPHLRPLVGKFTPH